MFFIFRQKVEKALDNKARFEGKIDFVRGGEVDFVRPNLILDLLVHTILSFCSQILPKVDFFLKSRRIIDYFFNFFPKNNKHLS